ncbi:MAG: hypothetical protein IKP88_15275 [Lachnospiraceae bacterium]|nr:hypothetical protein [Lachnospiraceae bacterium]
MKKIIILVVCCLLFTGCGSPFIDDSESDKPKTSTTTMGDSECGYFSVEFFESTQKFVDKVIVILEDTYPKANVSVADSIFPFMIRGGFKSKEFDDYYFKMEYKPLEEGTYVDFIWYNIPGLYIDQETKKVQYATGFDEKSHSELIRQISINSTNEDEAMEVFDLLLDHFKEIDNVEEDFDMEKSNEIMFDLDQIYYNVSSKEPGKEYDFGHIYLCKGKNTYSINIEICTSIIGRPSYIPEPSPTPTIVIDPNSGRLGEY